jgi:hypothetical protein
MRYLISKRHLGSAALMAAVLLLSLAGPAAAATATTIEPSVTGQGVLLVSGTQRSISLDYANIDAPIAGVAGGQGVVFVGEPLNGAVAVLSRVTGQPIGVLPPPPNGFTLPFIIHSIGEGRVAVLDAGGLPQPASFALAIPTIYEYAYSFSPDQGFSADLVRTVSFAGVPVGFSEDFIRLDDGRYLVSDAILGSIWVVQLDGTITPGIVPKAFDPQDFIPTLALCPTMPEITVNGIPFLFTGSTLPGVSPMAVRDGTVYYYSPCARGIYAFPLAILSDRRLPYQRAADIHLIAPTPSDVQVEELLDFSFNPFDPSDPYLYAADPLKLRIIRIDLTTGARQVLADDPKLFDFPSSLGFLPPIGGVTELAVVSNQQERTPLTNDAVTQTTFNFPFIVAKVLITP